MRERKHLYVCVHVCEYVGLCECAHACVGVEEGNTRLHTAALGSWSFKADPLLGFVSRCGKVKSSERVSSRGKQAVRQLCARRAEEMEAGQVTAGA